MSAIVRAGPVARVGAILIFIGPLVSWSAELVTAAAWQHPHYSPFYNWVSHLGPALVGALLTFDPRKGTTAPPRRRRG